MTATHGTVNMYQNFKCRCEPCRQAKKQQRLDLAPPPGTQPKGRFQVRYASANLVLDAEPLIKVMSERTELDANMRARFRFWRQSGIGVYQADYWCIKIGTHPYLVFGDKFYQGCPK